MLRILLLLASASCASAACGQLSTNVWDCPDSGNVYTNYANLRTFLSNHAFACGDTIILYAGVEYRRDDAAVEADAVPPNQAGCVGKKTKIVSSRANEIPPKQYQDLINYRAQMPSITTSNYGAFGYAGSAGGGTNNYAFIGIRFASSAAAVANRYRVGNLFMTGSFEFLCPSGVVGTATCQVYHDTIERYRPTGLEIDRCLFETYEDQVYGRADITNTNGNAFLRAVQIGISGQFKDFYMHDSYVSISGYTNTTAEGSYTSDWVDIATVTNANPAVIQGTGLLTALNITYSAGCTTATDDFTTPNAFGTACADHFRRVVIRNFSGAWVGLNGIRYVRARADGNLDVIIPGPDSPYHGFTYFDSTSLGTVATSGTPQMTGVALLAFYAILLTAAEDVRLIDNWLESWGMPIFAGGYDTPQIDQAVLQSGSTPTSIILNHIRGLRVGTVLTYNVPVGSGKSDYCHLGPGNGCYATDHYRSGRVTAISGLTVTLEPWGPDGVDDVNPEVGSAAWWRNDDLRNIQIRGNRVDRGYKHPNADSGKGLMEFKKGNGVFVDGNISGYFDPATGKQFSNVNGTYFTENKSQAGTDPMTPLRRIMFSNNVWGGYLTGADTATCPWRTNVTGSDSEHSVLLSDNIWFEHNVHTNCVAPTGTSFPFASMYGASSSGYRHNTYVVGMAQTAQHRFFENNGCDNQADAFYPEYSRLMNMHLRDNIMAYGDGPFEGTPSAATCWPDMTTNLTKNIVVDTESIGTSTINTAYPGNFIKADYTGMFDATCDNSHWENCKIAAAHAQRGAASDGGDPGADIAQVKDRINRWSEQAGLLQYSLIGSGGLADTPAMVNRSGNWTIGSTAVVVRFQLFNSLSSACTVELFTNRNRATAHADASSAQACNRTSSAVSGNTVAYTFGGASALTADTTYFYRITDGTRIMVGEFRTQPAGSGAAVSTYRYSSARTGNVCTDAAMTTSCSSISSAATHSVSVPQGAVRYYQAAGGAVIPIVAR